ncbi:MAG TPA: hypothetical protein VFG12_02545 [Rhodopila sp.]|nr:hypothetical protein [Rhodopila sp.]
MALLRDAGVPDRFYLTNGGPGTGECVGIEPVPGGWSVYDSERGQKAPLERCADGDTACRALLRHIDRMVRESGRGGVPG